MKTVALLLAGTAATFISAFATQQESDSLKYAGKQLYILECPLNSLWKRESDRPKFDVESTANWKGYVAGWEIRDNKLFLVSFAAKQGNKPFPVTRLFPGRKIPVFAAWYSGALNVPIRWRKRDRHYNDVYDRMLIFNVHEGTVLSVTEAEKAVFRYSRISD